jgi:hypothetical protein
MTDIDYAFTLIDRARVTKSGEDRERSRRNAREAYETVAEFVSSRPINDPDLTAIRIQLSELKAALQALGEIFPPPPDEDKPTQ